MWRRIACLLFAAWSLAACAGEQQAAPGAKLRPCDDGGSGGVIIDGVCL